MGAVDAIAITIRVKPGASRSHVGGRYDGPRGAALVVAVAERAVDGAATNAALAAVAKAVGVRRGAVTLVSGASSRDKRIRIIGGVDVAQRVDELRDS